MDQTKKKVGEGMNKRIRKISKHSQDQSSKKKEGHQLALARILIILGNKKNVLHDAQIENYFLQVWREMEGKNTGVIL